MSFTSSSPAVLVYEDNIDQIIGFIHVRDMFEDYTERSHRTVRELVRPIRFVPETKPNDLTEKRADGAWLSSSMSMETRQAW